MSGHDLKEWKPARLFPETYPGDCPEGHYLLREDRVEAMDEVGAPHYFAVDGEPLDELLTRLGVPPLPDRFPVVAYGANRNPATLAIKLRDYGYDPGAGKICIPVLEGSLSGADVVACGLHGQGYLYAELMCEGAFVEGVQLDVRVALVDRDQLRVLNDSEGIRDGAYSAARVPEVSVSGLPRPIPAVGYVTNVRAWQSPALGAPVSFSLVRAVGRRLPSMTARDVMEHVIDTHELREEIGRVSGLAPDATLAHELSKYLNGQWWYAFRTRDRPIAGYDRVREIFSAAMSTSPVTLHTKSHLESRGLLLEAEEAYHPDGALVLGAHL